ncbi:TPA: hypothetical protein DCR49_03170 [Candidatus Delongbacteria bacterium]|nr:MAG: hypothetical protein A2Y39_05910 [Candidatus Delongbacteria bacterium GWF2_40_14]HAQ60989.1 hypothetical protein [Candidatus Delongbacteria bacterium]
MKKQFFFVLTAAVLLFSQFRGTDLQPDPRLKLLSTSQGSVFDMSKISVSHSLSMSYTNSSSGSTMINEYVAGINYKISDPLSLKLNLGMSYTPYSSIGPVEDNTADIYIKSATLDYRPNDSFRMRVDFRNIKPSDYMNGDPFKPYNYFNDEE